MHTNLTEREVKAGREEALHVPKEDEEVDVSGEEPGVGKYETRKILGDMNARLGTWVLFQRFWELWKASVQKAGEILVLYFRILN